MIWGKTDGKNGFPTPKNIGIHDFKYSINKSSSWKWPLASQSQRGIFRMFTFSRHLTSDIIINEIVHWIVYFKLFSSVDQCIIGTHSMNHILISGLISEWKAQYFNGSDYWNPNLDLCLRPRGGGGGGALPFFRVCGQNGWKIAQFST